MNVHPPYYLVSDHLRFLVLKNSITGLTEYLSFPDPSPPMLPPSPSLPAGLHYSYPDWGWRHEIGVNAGVRIHQPHATVTSRTWVFQISPISLNNKPRAEIGGVSKGSFLPVRSPASSNPRTEPYIWAGLPASQHLSLTHSLLLPRNNLTLAKGGKILSKRTLLSPSREDKSTFYSLVRRENRATLVFLRLGVK